MCAMVRNALYEIKNAVVKVGGKVLNIGLRVLEFIFKAIELYPRTACGLLIVACIHGIARTIPFFAVGGAITGTTAILIRKKTVPYQKGTGLEKLAFEISNT